MDATVTLKLTVQELDTIREALHVTCDTYNEKAGALSVTDRQKLRVEWDKTKSLADKLR